MTSSALALRLVAFWIVLVVTWRFAGGWFDGAGGDGPASRLLSGACVSAVVVIAVLVLLRRDRLRWREVGVDRIGPNARAFVLGAALWLVPAALGAAACVAFGWSSVSLRSPAMDVLAALPMLAAAVFLLEAFPEELALRGYVQGLAARATTQWLALLLQAAVFVAFAWAVGAMDSPRQWMFIACLGLILGYVRALTGNVWACMGVHTAWMTTAQLVAVQMEVQGLETLQFVAFALLPSATIGAALGVLNPDFAWRRAAAA